MDERVVIRWSSNGSEIYTILFRLEILAQLCIGYSSRQKNSENVFLNSPCARLERSATLW